MHIMLSSVQLQFVVLYSDELAIFSISLRGATSTYTEFSKAMVPSRQVGEIDTCIFIDDFMDCLRYVTTPAWLKVLTKEINQICELPHFTNAAEHKFLIVYGLYLDGLYGTPYAKPLV